MCACVCACVCICAYLYLCVYVRVYVYACMCVLLMLIFPAFPHFCITLRLMRWRTSCKGLWYGCRVYRLKVIAGVFFCLLIFPDNRKPVPQIPSLRMFTCRIYFGLNYRLHLQYVVTLFKSRIILYPHKTAISVIILYPSNPKVDNFSFFEDVPCY